MRKITKLDTDVVNLVAHLNMHARMKKVDFYHKVWLVRIEGKTTAPSMLASEHFCQEFVIFFTLYPSILLQLFFLHR